MNYEANRAADHVDRGRENLRDRTPGADAGPVVEAKGINFGLRSAGEDLHILKDVNLAVDAAEVVAIVGPSGSGKTSLLMLLAGLDRATGGQVLIAGKEITGLNEDELARFRRNTVGILFQNFHLIPSLTALENVALALEIAQPKMKLPEIREAAAKALEEVGLKERLTHLPNMMSGGEQQRVGLARAMVTKPLLLLADEPTGNLDEDTGARVIDLMFNMAREQNTAVLLITHDRQLANRADRKLTMARGQLADLSEQQ
ncbi:ABC transporter ATP-binding protein [Devosia pacifica]|uniref:ABC transporter ATP-binding protein n=1 Tax=Devosia pacifica TaxID=1335967 RepID=A0A918VMC8_9HYPH|nr:ABC transporter ATP-binding protein [Devosia pacifica]GHA10242.1 ABC transporter ATP-binding protein [Devosia pacifica]